MKIGNPFFRKKSGQNVFLIMKLSFTNEKYISQIQFLNHFALS